MVARTPTSSSLGELTQASSLLNIQQLPLFTTEAVAPRGSFQEGNYTAQMR